MTGCKIGRVKPKLKVVESFPIVNPDILNALEDTLERCKRGDIVSGVWIFVTKEGGFFQGNSHTGAHNYLTLVGALEETKQHLMNVAKSVPQG